MPVTPILSYARISMPQLDMATFLLTLWLDLTVTVAVILCHTSTEYSTEMGLWIRRFTSVVNLYST